MPRFQYGFNKCMRLKDLIEPIEHRVYALKDVEVKDITCDSKVVRSGSLFAAVKGEHADGRAFAREAVENGALCVLAEAEVTDIKVPQVIVPDVRVALAKVAGRFYGEPSKGLKMVGITGTNGKTTAAYLVESIFKEAGLNAGVISTVNYRYGGKTLPAPLTTPEAPHLQKILREMADSGVTHCVMEVSSHALAQKRADGCWFGIKVFTNLSREHLDYHHTMEEYFNAKARLFTDPAFDPGSGVAIINIDDEWGEVLDSRLKDSLKYSLVYGKKSPDIFPGDFSSSSDGIEAEISTPAGKILVSSPFVGEYNLYNIMAAVGVGFSLGIEAATISKGINALKSVPGRLERVIDPRVIDPRVMDPRAIDSGVMPEVTGSEGYARQGSGGIKAFVDYAHTPDALERVLGALKGITDGRIITVFGCGGNRDRTKRPLMGEVSARLSDLTIVTSDNPRDEDPLEIIKEIEEGIKGVKRYGPEQDITEKGYTVIPERAEAIARAVSMAQQGDTVLVAGKGHENYQIVKGERLPFDDRTVLKTMINSACSIKGVG
jgi:UDP-N-acetylmuramoyl-L-alanyl-D-glutamate--2,6-diaminopimelate ligase